MMNMFILHMGYLLICLYLWSDSTVEWNARGADMHGVEAVENGRRVVSQYGRLYRIKSITLREDHRSVHLSS